MSAKIRILGFAGSLRKGSYNRILLKAAGEMVPEDASLETFELQGIPLFNQDLEDRIPERVKEFKSKIRRADAVLIVTPEYNFSIPGVLKNAIDWASRPYGDNSFEGKPVAIMGASPGMLGTVRSQHHLRQTLVFLNMHPVNKPEVLISAAHEKIDDKGKLVDKETKQYISELLKNLVDLTKQMKK